MDPFRPCGPHPGMPPASRASRPRARGCNACEDFQSSIVPARQSMDLFHRLRGPPSPCAGLRRLQGLAVGDCSYPSVHGPLPALRATFSVRGEDWGLVQMASPWGKLSAQLTEGVTARSNLSFRCKSKYGRSSSMDLFRPFRPHPGMPPASRASRPRTRGYNACEDFQSSIVLARQSMNLFHRFAVPLPRARGRLGLVQMASPWGKLSAQLTEGVTARSNLSFRCKSKYGRSSSMDLFRPFRPHPGMPPASRASRPRTRGCNACEDFQSSIVLARQSMDLFHRLHDPPSPCAGKAARLAALLFYRRVRA